MGHQGWCFQHGLANSSSDLVDKHIRLNVASKTPKTTPAPTTTPAPAPAPPPPGVFSHAQPFSRVALSRKLQRSVEVERAGAAKRRRERRLRSAWRHEQQWIARALAAATHHSAQPNAALRGPETGTRAREEVEVVTHAAPRGRGRHLCLRLPGRRWRQPLSVTWLAGAPSLVVALVLVLDGLDQATAQFLLHQTFLAHAEEEEENAEDEVLVQLLWTCLCRRSWSTLLRLSFFFSGALVHYFYEPLGSAVPVRCLRCLWRTGMLGSSGRSPHGMLPFQYGGWLHILREGGLRIRRLAG